METKKLKNYYFSKYPLTIIAYSPNGKFIAVASKFGSVYIFTENLEYLIELDDESEPD